jgi:hypothetical protein
MLALTMAVTTAAVAAAPASSVSMPVRKWGPYPLYQAYQTVPGDYGALDSEDNPDCIHPNRVFNGRNGQGEENVRTLPGIFCLDTIEDGCKLNILAFATCDPDECETDPAVQSFRLTKRVPGSYKAPCYGDPKYPPVYYQFGSGGVRTWWALRYTQPGTTFTLELTVRCLKPISKYSKKTKPVFHIDKWTWVVDANLDTFPLVIQELHSRPLSVLEFPCIADEGVFRKLILLTQELQDAVRDKLPRWEQQEAFFKLEGYVATQCLYADFFSPSYLREDVFGFDPQRIPGNFPTTSPSTYGGKGTGNWSPFTDPWDKGMDGGIVESFEDPCCCKLLADIEYLGEKYKIVSPEY